MKVVCINPPDMLTYGKIYDMIDLTGDFITVINDDGFEWKLNKNRFIALDDFRDIKLKELGI
jgi:hypothetical protein